MTNMKQTQDDRTIQPFNCSTIQRVKAYAFTLAETLIVIGIIGVVAALTLPNLNHATGDKEKVTKVKKIYASLTDAIDRAQAVYGDFDTWFNDLSTGAEANERFAKRVTEFMKVSKDCGLSEGCFSSSPSLFLDGVEINDNMLESFQTDKIYMVMLSDGVSLAFDARYGSGRAVIRVDIDGPNKGKNQDGVDKFNFSIYREIYNDIGIYQINQLLPSSPPLYWTGSLDKGDGYTQNETAWVIENGNLDYLKCLSELNWETQTSCK